MENDINILIRPEQTISFPEIDWDFVKANAMEDPTALRLRYLGRKDLTECRIRILKDSIIQIECRRRYARKIPGLPDRMPHFIFPSSLAAEQASHLWVAQLHANIASNLKVETLLDMTTGLGLDFMTMADLVSHSGEHCIAVELDRHKAECLHWNLLRAGLESAEVVCGDSMEVVERLPNQSMGLIFADPARRGEGDSRIYNPSDCLPDVVGHWEELLSKAKWVMVKNSPLLDLRRALELYPGTVRLVVTSVRNECKEVLVIAREGGVFEGTDCYNILGSPDGMNGLSAPDGISGLNGYPLSLQHTFIPASDWNAFIDTPIASAQDVVPGIWLYEPNASLMKAQPWSALCTRFSGLRKLSRNCHLFISTERHDDFPGRILQISSVPEGKAERKALKGTKWNVATRNHPLKPEELARKLGVKTGGEGFLYGVTVGPAEKPMLLTAE